MKKRRGIVGAKRLSNRISLSYICVYLICAVTRSQSVDFLSSHGFRLSELDALAFSTSSPLGFLPVSIVGMCITVAAMSALSLRFLYLPQVFVLCGTKLWRLHKEFRVVASYSALIFAEFCAIQFSRIMENRYGVQSFFRDDSYYVVNFGSLREAGVAEIVLLCLGSAMVTLAIFSLLSLIAFHLVRQTGVVFVGCVVSIILASFSNQFWHAVPSVYEEIANASIWLLAFSIAVVVVAVLTVCLTRDCADADRESHCRVKGEGLMPYVVVEEYSKIKKSKILLNHVSLNFESGKCYELRGKNGSGKTMLLRAIAGLVKPTNGHVKVNGKIIGTDLEFPPDIGLLIETPSFVPSYRGFENLKLIASIRGVASDGDIRECMNLVGLDPDDRRRFRDYSLGMKQRLGIACAVMERPKIVLLDEPLNALDDSGSQIVCEVIELCKSRDAIVIVANHACDVLSTVVDQTIYMRGGEVVQGAVNANGA